MRLPKNFEDNTWEEYQIYLESLNQEEVIPMEYEAFEWLKIRELEEARAERYEHSYEDCI